MSEHFQNKISTGTFAKLCVPKKKTLLFIMMNVDYFSQTISVENDTTYYFTDSFKVLWLFSIVRLRCR